MPGRMPPSPRQRRRRLPARRRAARRRLRRRLGSRPVRSAVKNRPAPPKSAFPTPAGRAWAKSSNRPTPRRTRRLPRGDGLRKGENRFPFGVFHFDRTQIPTRRSPSTSPRCHRRKRAAARRRAASTQRARGTGAARSPRRAGDRPLSRPRSKASRRSPPSGPRRRPMTRTRPRSSTRPSSTSPATASGGSRP